MVVGGSTASVVGLSVEFSVRWKSGAMSIDGDRRGPALMGFTVGFLSGDRGDEVCGLLFFSMGLTMLSVMSTMTSVTRSASWSNSGTGWICFGRWRGSVEEFMPVCFIYTSNGVHSRCLNVKGVLSKIRGLLYGSQLKSGSWIYVSGAVRSGKGLFGAS